MKINNVVEFVKFIEGLGFHSDTKMRSYRNTDKGLRILITNLSFKVFGNGVKYFGEISFMSMSIVENKEVIEKVLDTMEHHTNVLTNNSLGKITLEEYLIDVGIRASDNGHVIYNEERELLKDNVEYFSKCHKTGLSACKALLFFGDYLKGDYNI